MMQNKLIQSDYPKDIVSRVICFLEEYHYLDDKQYIHSYVNSYNSKKSKRQMTFDLIQKGIAKELIEEFFYETDYAEEDCLKRQFMRYIQGKDLTDNKIKQKVFRHFYGKGFSVSLIEDMIRTQA